MIGIGFENMKVIKNKTFFNFSPITLLTGTNNSGKSSIINAIQMLQENVKVKTIDELMNVEIKLSKTQSKYGSIENFVNNESITKSFSFNLKNKDYEYEITVQIKDGLETTGYIKSLKIFDYTISEEVFHITRTDENKKFSYACKFNFEYFVKNFYEKYELTLECEKEFLDLKKMHVEYNSNLQQNKYSKELDESLTFKIKRFNSKYNLCLDRHHGGSKNDDGHYEEYDILFFDVAHSFRETKIIFDPEILSESGNKEDDAYFDTGVFKYFNLLKKNSIQNNGLFDFTSLFKLDPELEKNYKKIIIGYYEKDFESSNKLFFEDFVKEASKTTWLFELANKEQDNTENKFIIEEVFSFISNFGLFRSGLSNSENNIPTGNFNFKGTVKNNFLESSNPSVKELFVREVYDLLLESYVIHQSQMNEGNLSFNHFLHRLSSIIINDDMKKVICKLNTFDYNFTNCSFVASNRFSISNTHSFYDNTDFTNYLKLIEKSDPKEKKESIEFIEYCLKEFGIADKLLFKPDKDGGNFKVYLEKNNKEVLLSNDVLGSNQLLPILFSLAFNQKAFFEYQGDSYKETSARTVFIEEPESNLHPALQSKLADLFIDANKKFKVQIIAETHSEYLVRKIQYLTAKEKIKPWESVIYYFYNPNHPAVLSGDVGQISKITIDEEGALSDDFGSGFFDEADNIAMELFLLKNHQKN